MNIREANNITGGLSSPSKMPCKSYNLSAKKCKLGSLLREHPNTVCSGCYALKGRYMFPTVQAALERRRLSLNHISWIEAMAHLINKQSPDYFRWHDSGDLQDLPHLLQIVRVAEKTPNTLHWLPTRECSTVREYLCQWAFPDNLIIRVSAPLINQFPILGKHPWNSKLDSGLLGSMVVTKEGGPDLNMVFKCPAYSQGGVCGDCRACWDRAHKIVAYPKH